MNSRPIQNPGFLIDFDGLLINSESLSMVAFEKLCGELGCQFTQDYHASIRGKKKSQWAEEFVENFSLSESAVMIAELHTKLLLSEMDDSVGLLPGADDLLNWIGENCYPAALVTSSDRKYAETYLKKLGIEDSFQQLVTSEDVRHGKPDPEPYVIGAMRINKEPQNCIVLEDSVNGVLSGKAAGAIVFAVPSTESDRQKLVSSDFVVLSLVEALGILRGMGL